MRIIGTLFAALFVVATALTAVVPSTASAEAVVSTTENGGTIITFTNPGDPAYPPEGLFIPESCVYWGAENGQTFAVCSPGTVIPPGATVCEQVGTENGEAVICRR